MYAKFREMWAASKLIFVPFAYTSFFVTTIELIKHTFYRFKKGFITSEEVDLDDKNHNNLKW